MTYSKIYQRTDAFRSGGIVANSVKASSIEFLSRQVPSDDLSNVKLAEYPPHLPTEIIKTVRRLALSEIF